MNTRAQSSGKLAKNIKRSIPIYLLALPGLIYLAINNYVPMASLVVAFKNYSAKRGIWGSDWCGFKNFKYLFGTRDAWTITRNTLCYNIAFIVIGTIMTVTIAILLSEIKGKRRGKFYQSAILLPYDSGRPGEGARLLVQCTKILADNHCPGLPVARHGLPQHCIFCKCGWY